MPPLRGSSSLADKIQRWTDHLASIGRLEHGESGEILAIGTAGAYSLNRPEDLNEEGRRPVRRQERPSLPEDPAALRAMLLAVLVQRDTLAAERDAAVAQNERLLALLAKLRRMQFGRKLERLPEDQLLLAFEEIEATLAERAAEAGQQSPTLREQQT